MYYFILTILIGATIAEKTNIYTHEYVSFEDHTDENHSVSPTPLILIDTDSDENEVQIKSNRNKKYRGRSSYANDGSNEDDGSYEGKWIDTIPGKAGDDYPSYSEIPKTGFSCKGRSPSGYFADIETDCQVFHICISDGQKISFLCPNGSIFNQKVLVCDWWYDVDCQTSIQLAEISNEIARREEFNQNQNQNQNQYTYENFAIEEGYDLNLASSGGNQHPKHSMEAESTTKETIMNEKREHIPRKGENNIQQHKKIVQGKLKNENSRENS